MIRTIGAAALLALATAMPVQEAYAQDPLAGALIGGALGAGVGAAVGGGRGSSIAIGAIIGAGAGALLGAILGGGKGAAIGAVIGGGAGAGSVIVQGRTDVKLQQGSVLTISSSSPVRRDQQTRE